jgi:hypothetical protein
MPAKGRRDLIRRLKFNDGSSGILWIVTGLPLDLRASELKRRRSYYSQLSEQEDSPEQDTWCSWVISGFRHDVYEICTLLGYNAAYSGNSLLKFRDNLSVLSSRVKEIRLKTGLVGCPETSLRNYHYTLRNVPEERRSHLVFLFLIYLWND